MTDKKWNEFGWLWHKCRLPYYTREVWILTRLVALLAPRQRRHFDKRYFAVVLYLSKEIYNPRLYYNKVDSGSRGRTTESYLD